VVAIAVAVLVAVVVNIAAAALDARSGDERRAAAARDVRARLAQRHVSGARVACSSGLACTVVLADGRAVAVDPRSVVLPAAVR